MKGFYFIAEKISYTFSVAFCLSLFGIIEGVSSYVIGMSFAGASYDAISKIFMQWLPIIFLGAIFLLYIVSGILTPVKIPPLLSRFRRVDNMFADNPRDDGTLLKELYSDFSNLVIDNTIISAVFSIIAALSITAIFVWKYYAENVLSFAEFQASLKVTAVSSIVFMILFCMTAYIISGYLTNTERSKIYNRILKGGELIKPHAFFRLAINLLFFISISAVIICASIAFYKRINSPDYNKITLILSVLFLLLTLFFLIMAGFNSILKFLNDITRITREIVHGANVSGFSIIPLSKEFAAPEYALLSMTRSIDDKRKNLENELQERSIELERALKEIKTRNEIIREQSDKVNAIRKNILPAEIDDWNELKFSVKYNAMEKIGGDFYDIFHLNDNKIGILIGDVSCHGVPAALIAAMAKISFNSAMHNYDSPKRIFQEVNKDIIDILQGDDYMSCFMAVIDDEYNVTYSNAGHQKGIIFRKEIEGIELLDTEGLFIGSLEDAIDSYEEKTTKLNSGDRLILYTDGIPEAQNRSGEKYSNKRMERFIIKNKDMPLEDFTEAMLRGVHEYAEGNDSADDMSLLAVELAADEAMEIINSSLKLIDKNKYLDAAELLENGLGRHPNNLKIIYNLGKVYFRINNYEKSIHLFDKYLKRDKKNKYAFYVNGASHYQMMNYKEAAENFKEAVQIDPDMINALLAIGMSYKNLNDYDAAIEIFEQALGMEAGNKTALSEINQIKKLKSGSAL